MFDTPLSLSAGTVGAGVALASGSITAPVTVPPSFIERTSYILNDWTFLQRIARGGDRAVYTGNLDSTVRNIDCWAYGLDLSCIPAQNPNQGGHTGSGSGALVTSRHLICASHWAQLNGFVYTFVSANGIVETATQAGRAPVPISTGVYFDIEVILLDRDLPDYIKPAKVMPANWEASYPGGLAHGIPVIMSKNMLTSAGAPTYSLAELRDLNVANFNLTSTTPNYGVYHEAPSQSDRLALYADPLSGDSGQPTFAVIGQDLVLLKCHFGSSMGPALHKYLTQINAMINNISPGYQLTLSDPI